MVSIGNIFFRKLKSGCQPYIKAPSGKIVRHSEGARHIILVRDCFNPGIGNDIFRSKQVENLSTDPDAFEMSKGISIFQVGIFPFQNFGKTNINAFVGWHSELHIITWDIRGTERESGSVNQVQKDLIIR